MLLLRRSITCDFCPGKWCFPGGHVEGREEYDVAALREAAEETGLDFRGQLTPAQMHMHQNKKAICFYFGLRASAVLLGHSSRSIEPT